MGLHLQTIHIVNPECPVRGVFEKPVFKQQVPWGQTGLILICICHFLSLHCCDLPGTLDLKQSWSVLPPHQVTNAW